MHQMEKYGLKHVFGVFRAVRDAVRRAKDQLAVLPEKRIECLPVDFISF